MDFVISFQCNIELFRYILLMLQGAFADILIKIKEYLEVKEREL